MFFLAPWHRRCISALASNQPGTGRDERPRDSFDQLTRFVRVRSEPDARFVEFDFAIGHPELFVELVLPQAAFATFCQCQRVVQMDAAMCQAVDEDAAKWRYGDVGRREANDRE